MANDTVTFRNSHFSSVEPEDGKTPSRVHRTSAVVSAISLMIAGMFLFSSLSQIQYPYRFLDNVLAYKIVSGWPAVAVAIYLPQLQLLVAGFLLVGVWRQAAAAIASGLFALFALAQGSVLVRGMSINCGCWGSWHQPVSVPSVLVVVVLSIISLWLCCRCARGGIHCS